MIFKNGKLLKRKILTGLILLTLCFFVSCAEDTPKEAKDAETLKKVALSYWKNRLITRDYKASYAREESAGLPAFEEYSRLVSQSGKFAFSGLKTANPEVVQNRGEIDVSVMAKGPGMPAAFEHVFKDSWVYGESGMWQHRFSKNQP